MNFAQTALGYHFISLWDGRQKVMSVSTGTLVNFKILWALPETARYNYTLAAEYIAATKSTIASQLSSSSFITILIQISNSSIFSDAYISSSEITTTSTHFFSMQVPTSVPTSQPTSSQPIIYVKVSTIVFIILGIIALIGFCFYCCFRTKPNKRKIHEMIGVTRKEDAELGLNENAA